ncbi:MAG TPA: DUF1592 domain-containing protein [Polyangiaceae bacterium]|nr:DUF1592 domain-containing protein [Polyangiaceae bacterium]
MAVVFAAMWNRYRSGCSFLLGVLGLGCTAQVSGSGSPASMPGGGGASAAAGASGLGGAAITAGSGGGSTTARGIDLPGEPKYYRFVRLTNSQWAHAVQDVLKLAAPSGLEANFQNPVSGATDFTNNELLLDVNQRGWSDYQEAAEKLANQVTATDAALAAVYSGTDAAGFIKTLGRRAYRRPLTDAEVASYTTLFNGGAALSGTRSAFAKGASLVLRALLQSPYFLYRSEIEATGAPLNGYEVAAKLSLWLRDTTPSDALLDSAPTLTTADAVGQAASALLADAAAKQVMREFHRELLHFDRYSQISKINVPGYTESLNAEYQQSSELFFDRIFTQGLGLRDALTSTRGFVGPGMAPLYGLQVSGTDLVEQDLGPTRVGYFSQLPYLTLNAFNAEPDSIHRGVSLNLDVLCAPLGPPAATIPPVPALQAGQTNRQRISTLTAGCGGVCHNEMINPLGFAFEHFDGMGQYRDAENGGLPIDSSGAYTFSEGTKTYQDAAGLMQAMADSEQAHLCYSKNLASFGLQRDIVPSDVPWLTALSTVSKAPGGSLKQVMLELVKSDAFRTHLGGMP